MAFWYNNRKYDETPDVSKERWAEIKKKFPHFPDNEDIGATRREAFIRLPAFVEDWAVATLLQDPRDAIMLSTIFNIVASCGPMTVYMWLYPSHSVGFLF